MPTIEIQWQHTPQPPNTVGYQGGLNRRERGKSRSLWLCDVALFMMIVHIIGLQVQFINFGSIPIAFNVIRASAVM